MADDITTPRRAINAQHPIEAPRVQVGTQTAWAGLTGRNALSPKAIRPAPMAARAPRSDAGVTVPAGVVIQVLPSMWDRVDQAPALPPEGGEVSGGYLAKFRACLKRGGAR